MTPEPAANYWKRELAKQAAALAAAKAEVLALREAAKNVRSMLERDAYDPESLLYFVAQDIRALLPAPTEEEQRG